MASATAVPVSGPQLDNRRVLAALIDLVVVGVGAAAIQAAAGVLGDSPSKIGAPLIAVTLGWALYYYFVCESSDSGQTLGKRVMNLRVARANGGSPEMRDIAMRTVLRVIDMQFVYLVGLIVMLATGERRGRLGDLVAGTSIVSADQPAAAPAVAAVEAVGEEPAPAPRVPIAESGPAFEPVAGEEPVVEEEPVAEVEPVGHDEPVAEDELLAEDDPLADEEPVVEVEPIAEVEHEPGDDDTVDSDDDTVDMASPSLKELAADVEATAGSAPDEEPAEVEVESAEEEPVAEGEPAEDPEPETEGDDEVALPPAAEVEDRDEDDVKRIETVSAIDLVMEDSQRKS
jgi:uncharacterized RDD family membrane protein YckC